MPAEYTGKETYSLSPFCRLRNECDGVVLHNLRGAETAHVPRAYGIVLTLCDGERTIDEIARAAIPLLREPESDNAFQQAKRRVAAIVDFFRKSKAERAGTQGEHDPLTSALVAPDELALFSPARPPQYDPWDFVPHKAFPPSKFAHPFRHRAPISILWHLTADCATDCQYCYLPRRKIAHSDLLPWPRLLELIEEARALGVFGLEPAGGDVLLYPYIVDFLDAIAKGGFFPVSISTKSFLSPERAEQLANCSALYELQLSIDSTVEEIADFLVQKPGYCRRILQSIDNALDGGLRVACKAVITPYNLSTIPKLYRDLRRRGVKKIRLATYCRSAYRHEDTLFNDPGDYAWLDAQIRDLEQEFSEQIVLQNGYASPSPLSVEQREVLWQERSMCGAGRTLFMTCADGKVIPCEQLPETEEMFCGDLGYQSIEEVWDGEALRNVTYGIPRRRYKGTVCWNCPDIEECHDKMGYCIRDTYIACGTIYDAPPNCPRSRRFVRQM